MPKPVRFDDDKVEPVGHIVRCEHIARDRQTTKRELVVEGRIAFVLVRPFDEIVVAVVAGENALGIGLSNDNTALAQTVHLVIAVEPVIAGDQVARARQHAEMLELADAV